jgi:HSP20 family protein
MLDTLKQAGKNIGRELGRTSENLSEGWRELLSRSSDALTHFSRNKEEASPERGTLATFPRWGRWRERWKKRPRRSWCG